MTKHHGLVTGAYEIVGLNLVEELIESSEWRVTAIGRRPASPIPGLDYISVDLADAAKTQQALAHLKDVTHLFFGAYQYHPDPYEECAINVAIAKNTLDALRAAGAKLDRVVLYQGSKAYGGLLRPVRTPAKESDPRVPGPLYYFDQEDFVYSQGARDGFGTTVLRPDYIAGIGLGSYVNLVNTVAAYGSICKAIGIPMYYPGGPEAFNTLIQLTDARLLGRGSMWAAIADKSGDIIYNITNGDLFRWSNIWPRIADFFGVAAGHPMHIDLKLFMRDKGPLRQQLKARHGLSIDLDQIQNWDQSQILQVASEIHTSTIRIRKAGFQECLDSDDRMIELLGEMRQRKYIP